MHSNGEACVEVIVGIGQMLRLEYVVSVGEGTGGCLEDVVSLESWQWEGAMV